MSKAGTTFGVIGVIGVMFSVPFYFRANTPNLYKKDGQLTGSQMQRGLFTANGTDGGLDPDWDFKTNSYTGYNKFKKRNKEGDALSAPAPSPTFAPSATASKKTSDGTSK